jgi:hypothetical protein
MKAPHKVLETVATLRKYVKEVQQMPEGRRLPIYAKLLDAELRRYQPRRSVARKLFTLHAALAKKQAWARLEKHL